MDGELTDEEIAFYVDTMNAANFRDTRRMALEILRLRANAEKLREALEWAWDHHGSGCCLSGASATIPGRQDIWNHDIAHKKVCEAMGWIETTERGT